MDVFDSLKDGIACDWYGTSMAAPHVTGAIAILKASRPTATVDQMVSALVRNGVGVVDSRNGVNRARINVANAVYYF
jgi:subtilisin